MPDRQRVQVVHQHRQPVGLRDGVEEGLVAGRDRLLAQQPRAEGVEGRADQLLVGIAQELLGTGAHLLGRLGGEGQRQHAFGRRSLLGKPCDPACDHARLAASGPRDHQQRAAGVRDRLGLTLVQPAQEGVRGCCLHGGRHWPMVAPRQNGTGGDFPYFRRLMRGRAIIAALWVVLAHIRHSTSTGSAPAGGRSRRSRT